MHQFRNIKNSGRLTSWKAWRQLHQSLLKLATGTVHSSVHPVVSPVPPSFFLVTRALSPSPTNQQIVTFVTG